MGKSGVRVLQGVDYNAGAILDLANAYYEMSATFTSNLPTTINGFMEQRFLGVASATNRILALELYFKAVLVLLKAPFPITHDLVVLFNSLPESIRQDAERVFNERVHASPKKSTWVLHYFLGEGAMPSIDERERAEREALHPDASLGGLLERNKSGFVDSRYLFQYLSSTKPICFTYDFYLLAILCGIFCEQLEGSLCANDPDYRRRFDFEVGPSSAISKDYSDRAAYAYSSNFEVSKWNIDIAKE